MRRHLALATVLFLALTSAVSAQQPFERLRRSCGAYYGERDPFGFPVRVYFVSQTPYNFWLGGQDLFFIWCKANAGDWIADADSAMSCNGNVSPASIGAYPADGPFGKLAFGIQTFDDSARIPFQCELLQQFITLRLLAAQNYLDLTNANLDELVATLGNSSRDALSSSRNATSLFADDAWVGKLLSADSPYTAIIDQYTSVGQFRRVINDPAGKARELLRVDPDAADAAATVLADAVANDRNLARRLRYETKDEFRTAIRDAATRTVLANPIAPGGKELLVLVLRPVRDVDHDMILLLRRQVPAAAERAGVAKREQRVPAERSAADAERMMDPGPFLAGFGKAGADSYTVRLFDPWSRTLADQDVRDYQSLLHLARIWGTLAGLTHRQGNEEQIAHKLHADLNSAIRTRSDAYLKQLREDYDRFNNDSKAIAAADAGRLAVQNASNSP